MPEILASNPRFFHLKTNSRTHKPLPERSRREGKGNIKHSVTWLRPFGRLRERSSLRLAQRIAASGFVKMLTICIINNNKIQMKESCIEPHKNTKYQCNPNKISSRPPPNAVNHTALFPSHRKGFSIM